MTVGLHGVNLANKFLDLLRGTAFTAPSGLYVKLHTGDPGASASANASANTTRVAITFAAASAGSMAMNGTAPSWASWASGSETISHLSFWDASTSGNCLATAALTVSKAVTNGDTLNMATCTWAFTPIAA